MSSEFGDMLKVSVFGQSHGKAIGAVIDGLPAGFKINMDELYAFMARRAPGGKYATARKEKDSLEIVSGLVDDVTCGAPLCVLIRNEDQHSSDYSEIAKKPRPAHADYTAFVKYKGYADVSGGGHFSGRLTAPICAVGGICLQILKQRGISVGAHIASVGDISDELFDAALVSEAELENVKQKDFPAISDEAAEKMKQVIDAARNDMDSVGGVIECCILGVPAGVGDPMFDGVENKLASAMFGIPAIKGIEFGSGFEGAKKRGSENNDDFMIKDGKIVTATNNHGGILGGITSGMPVVLRVAIKPTPSIGMEQKTVDLSSMNETELSIKGRHDPCIAVRAVPCIEAVSAITILDMLLKGNV